MDAHISLVMISPYREMRLKFFSDLDHRFDYLFYTYTLDLPIFSRNPRGKTSSLFYFSGNSPEPKHALQVAIEPNVYTITTNDSYGVPERGYLIEQLESRLDMKIQPVASRNYDIPCGWTGNIFSDDFNGSARVLLFPSKGAVTAYEKMYF